MICVRSSSMNKMKCLYLVLLLLLTNEVIFPFFFMVDNLKWVLSGSLVRTKARIEKLSSAHMCVQMTYGKHMIDDGDNMWHFQNTVFCKMKTYGKMVSVPCAYHIQCNHSIINEFIRQKP